MMAKISLTGGFEPIPEGIYVFKITKVDYNPDFGKMAITMKTQEGKTHVETFRLLGKDGKPHAGAMTAFSYFARTAMNDMDLDEIDEQDLVGHYIKATVEHSVIESNTTPGKMLTFVQLVDKEPSDGFDGEEGYMDTAKDDGDPDDLLKSLLG